MSISVAKASAVGLSSAVRSTALVNSVLESFSALARPSKPFSSVAVSPAISVALNLRMMAFFDSATLSS